MVSSRGLVRADAFSRRRRGSVRGQEVSPVVPGYNSDGHTCMGVQTQFPKSGEELIMWRSRVVLVLVLLSVVLAGLDGHAGAVQRLAGRVPLKINSAVSPREGFDFTWGKGTLTLIDGT